MHDRSRPGRPRHPGRDEYHRLRLVGLKREQAAEAIGAGLTAAKRWDRASQATGYNSNMSHACADSAAPGSDDRYLSLDDRILIADRLHQGQSLAAIARELSRARSSISREVARNSTHGGYQPYGAHRKTQNRRPRPKLPKLLSDGPLRRYVWQKLQRRWSPAQISAKLAEEFPADQEMHVSHETIYQALYLQARGGLRREVQTALRTGRARRRPTGQRRKPRTLGEEMIMISQRPSEIEDRAVPGHWEGDLILGAANRSAIATLVERHTRFVMLCHLPGDHTAETVAAALTQRMGTLPAHLRGSLTWDQGVEMAEHHKITMATDLPIYFCDPASPWQRGSNENTNGLLRQYFPRGTDLSLHGPEDLEHVANELNGRPRKTLGWKNPAECMKDLLITS
ncbi:IS30 family transposase [Nesterenkonia suensis]